ncbi:sensor histidine kinase [Ectobacillus sp. JY-23]|uniref:sensor histidine kinase n=1 Tax=Ectobacillus sp. JY-23 TaxID=2933872 RepID=UPI001FF6270A|nr:sensor histidine kinase [Ectobacillus sp. JY-23]UOY92565.1 sensor histidine kinase [Ectobacillus sp. JY-23]
MATKWKSSVKTLIWLLVVGLGCTGTFSLLLDGINFTYKTYFDTPQFEGEKQNYLSSLSELELNYVPKEEAKQQIKVTAEEIHEHRYRYGDLNEQIGNITAQYEDKINSSPTPEVAGLYKTERDAKIADITKNFQDDEHVRAKVVKEKEKKLDEYYQNLENTRPEYKQYDKSFKYFLTNTVTGKVHTNLNVEDYSAAQKLLAPRDMLWKETYDGKKTLQLNSYFDNQSLTGGQFQGIIAVPKWTDEFSHIVETASYYKKQQQRFFIYTGVSVLLLIAGLYAAKFARPFVPIAALRPYYKKVPFDIRLGAFAFTLLLAFVFIIGERPFMYYEIHYTPANRMFFSILASTCLIAATLPQAWVLWKEWREESIPTLWQRTWCYHILEFIQKVFFVRSVGMQIVILMGLLFTLGFSAVFVAVQSGLIIVYMPFVLLVGVPIFLYILKQTAYFNEIFTAVKEIAGGNLRADLPVKGRSPLAFLAADINILKNNVSFSQKEQAKSERLKTELITNVSHDLRTPLTSIITYTDLLKSSNLTEDERSAYVQVLDRKSKRLKVLIDDLFEASKMMSGNIELALEQADIVQLLQQSLAEHDDNISQSTLQFRVTQSENQIFAVVDGQKMWRVFDNLISNILKYSLEHSRVYINATSVGEDVTITFKNVSKYELGGNTEELLERFKRGDTSRHTDGSGLGLAIAKSIVDLHGGELDIELDGDLFKITITLRKSVR